MSYDIYTGLLKAFELPTAIKSDVKFAYDNSHPKLDRLKSTYPIEAVAGDGDDFSKAVNLLKWVSGHIYHKSDYVGSTPCNALDLLDYAYDKGSANGINCVCLATILTESLLAIGLKARTIFIFPCSPYDGDNHCVTHVYAKEINKWVMIDPTYNAYITNNQGQPLSLVEIRNHLANQEPVFFSAEAKYNDDEWTNESAKAGIEYYAKDSFYYQTSELSAFDSRTITGNRTITLCPQGYNAQQVRVSNIDYRIKVYGSRYFDEAFMLKLREEEAQREYHYCSTTDFEATN